MARKPGSPLAGQAAVLHPNEAPPSYPSTPQETHHEHPSLVGPRGALCALGALAPAAATAQQAQQPVQITTTKFGDNFYAIDGQGGRMGALVGPDGVFLVDAQFPQVTDRIVAAIRQITNAPIKYLVNTHMHGDHTGGNENFARLGRHHHLAAPAPRASRQPRAAGQRGPPPHARAAVAPVHHLRHADDDPDERGGDRADPAPARPY